MDFWGTYERRLGASGDPGGDPRRASSLSRAQAVMRRKIAASPSFYQVQTDGRKTNVVILDMEEFNQKRIVSMPGEKLIHGGIVEWNDSFWLITEVDMDNGVYDRGLIQRCNYLLRWIDDRGNVISKRCIVEDGTKYLIGEKTSDMMTIGDARIAVTIGKDSDTNKLVRGMRFLIDDMDSTQVLAYQITKPNKLYSVYDGEGVFRFILNEVNLTDNDNVELRIADYYSWVPKKNRIPSDVQTGETVEEIVQESIKENLMRPNEMEREDRWI